MSDLESKNSTTGILENPYRLIRNNITPSQDPYVKLFKILCNIDCDAFVQYPIDLKETIDWVLNEYLYERERLVIIWYFGLDPSTGKMTLQAIGDVFKVSHTRISSIKSTALRKLRNPHTLKIIKDGLTVFNSTNHDRAKNKKPNESSISNDTKNNFNNEADFDSYISNIIESATNDHIDTLDLPIRVYNAIYRKGIRTVYELLQRNDDELSNIRNLGERGRIATCEAIDAYLKNFDTNRIEFLELHQSYKESKNL